MLNVEKDNFECVYKHKGLTKNVSDIFLPRILTNLENWYTAFIYSAFSDTKQIFSTKGWDLSESGKKTLNPFFTQNSDFELWMAGHLPMNSWIRKSTPKIRLAPMGA